MAELSVRRSSWRQWSGLASTWERIHQGCPAASFFLSRDWVDCWLATFGADLNPELLEFLRHGEVVGCCLLVWRTQWVGGIPLRRVYLNCAGEDDEDSTCIEYNSVLSLPDFAEEVARALEIFLRSRYWDEFHLPGVEEHSPVCAVANSLGRGEVTVRPSHYLDLVRLRDGSAGFDAALSPNTRQQIRRSQRLYEQTSGPCILRVAQTAGEAAEIFARLAGLHQAAWRQRGRPGVFASARFTGFHQRLIQAGFDHNRVFLVELSAGSEVIGALYSLVYRGRVYFYQSGFHYTGDGRLKPGLLTHYLAIHHCLQQPAFTEYDFLAGDSQYKRSLAAASRPLLWMVVRRSTVPSLLLRGLRLVKHHLTQGQ